MGDRRINFTTRIDREVWFRFRDLCHSHKVSVERAVEALFREALRESGIEVRERTEDSASVKAEPMVRGSESWVPGQPDLWPPSHRRGRSFRSGRVAPGCGHGRIPRHLGRGP